MNGGGDGSAGAAGAEKFIFDSPSAALVYHASELSIIEYGRNEVRVSKFAGGGGREGRGERKNCGGKARRHRREGSLLCRQLRIGVVFNCVLRVALVSSARDLEFPVLKLISPVKRGTPSLHSAASQPGTNPAWGGDFTSRLSCCPSPVLPVSLVPAIACAHLRLPVLTAAH